jgi:glycosyltransferase involved in cell wall biosynthesis
MVYLIICVSEGIKAHYVKEYGIRNIVVFENGYPEKLKSINKIKNFKKDKINVGFVGLYTEWQDFYSCCKVFLMIKSFYPKSTLRFIGDGPCKVKWQAIAQNLGIKVEWIEPLGYDQIEIAYNGLDVGLIPDLRLSSNENFSSPIKLVEYIASNVFPLIVRNEKCFEAFSGELLTIDKDFLDICHNPRDKYSKLIIDKVWASVVNEIEKYIQKIEL